MHRLFVYGSLSKGNINEHLLKDLGGNWKQASLKGFLHYKGWGAALGFPGLVLHEKGVEIKGYVFSSNHLEDFWDELDAFEGPEYARILTKVTLCSMELVNAYVYVLRDSDKIN